MSAPVSREKEPETGTRDKPRQAPVPRISTREIRLEESWCCFSLSGSENHCRPGSGGPFPVGLARIFSGWQRTSHVVVVVAVVVSSPGLALPPGPGYARWQVTRFPRPGRSLLTAGAGPGRAHQPGQLPLPPLPSCSRTDPRVPVRVFVPAHWHPPLVRMLNTVSTY